VSKYLSERSKSLYPSKIREAVGKVKRLKEQGFEITDCTIGRPDFDTPEHIKEAAKKALEKGLVHYGPSSGTLEFREAVCYRYEQDYQLKFDSSNVVATVGSSQAINVALQAVLNPEDEIIVPEPMYVFYRGWIFLTGAKIVTFKPEKDFLPKAEEIEKNITSKTKALLLTSPNNPTGQVIDTENLKKIAKVVIKYDLIVIADDIYNKMLYDNVDYMPIAKVPGMRDRTIIIGSFSKTYAMDGWRIGYIIAPKEIMPGIAKLHQHMINCPSTFVQSAACAALTGSQDCVKEMVVEFDRRRHLIMSHLDKMKIPYVKPRGAFYIFPSIKQFGLNSEEFYLYLLKEARVATVPGYAFGKAGEGHIRIAFSTSYKSIEKGLARMKVALEKLANK